MWHAVLDSHGHHDRLCYWLHQLHTISDTDVVAWLQRVPHEHVFTFVLHLEDCHRDNVCISNYLLDAVCH
jgi:hypothetical protein